MEGWAAERTCEHHQLDGSRVAWVYARRSGSPVRRDSGAPCALAHEGLDVTEDRPRVTASRRQSRRRAASVTVAVPPMRCIRAGRLVRGRLGVLGGRSGSTCDASVSAIGPCSQRRRHVRGRRYPLVKTWPGLSPALDEALADGGQPPVTPWRGAGRSEDLDPVLRREGGKSGDVG